MLAFRIRSLPPQDIRRDLRARVSAYAYLQQASVHRGPAGSAASRSPMKILPQVAWPISRQASESSSASETSYTGSESTSPSRTPPQPLKRNSESRDADEDPQCDNAYTAATSLLMLLEEEGKPAVAPMPFFQFPRVAPAALTSDPPIKRACSSFGKKAASVIMAWPPRGNSLRGDASRGDCSPRATHRRAPPSSQEMKETLSKMVQARLSSGSESSEQQLEPTAWTHAPSATSSTPLAA